MADNWKVLNQRQTSMVVAGTFVPAQEVTFETTDGDTGSVQVPLSQFSPDTVRQAIEERVQALSDVRNL